MARFLNSRRKALFVQMDEIANFRVSAKQVIDEQALRNLPMLVVARDDQAAADTLQENREAEWRRAQQQMTALSEASEFVLAEGSDHFIHLRKPNWLARRIDSFVAGLLTNGI